MSKCINAEFFSADESNVQGWDDQCHMKKCSVSNSEPHPRFLRINGNVSVLEDCLIWYRLARSRANQTSTNKNMQPWVTKRYELRQPWTTENITRGKMLQLKGKATYNETTNLGHGDLAEMEECWTGPAWRVLVYAVGQCWWPPAIHDLLLVGSNLRYKYSVLGGQNSPQIPDLGRQ